MAYFVAAGLNFSPLPEGVAPTGLTVGQYYDCGRFGPAPMAARPVYDDRPITFPGVDGVVTVRFGFRGRAIFATLVFAGTDSQCNSTCKSVLDALAANARYTVALPAGASFDGCKLLEANQGTFVNMSGGCLLVVPCIFNQLSTTN